MFHDRVGLLVLLSFVFTFIILSTGYTSEEFPDEYCMECHGEEGMVSEAGESIYVDNRILARSVHNGFECTDCHSQEIADFEDIPHYEEYKEVDCSSCHPRTAAVWMEHFYKMLEKKGLEDIPDCVECHGAHDARMQMGMEIVCDRCHQSQANQYRQSYHFQKYPEDPHTYPICTTCHDPHYKFKREVMSAQEYRQEIVDICSRCHRRDIERYIHSRHFHEFERGNLDAPICTSCHETHAIRHPTDSLSSVHPLNISPICNDCHPGHIESLHRQPGADSKACSACHTGHQTDMASINRAIFKEGGIFNQCNVCHLRERQLKRDLAHGRMMLTTELGAEANCTKCHIYHYDMPGLDAEAVKNSKIQCESCHIEEQKEYATSIHGRARAQGFEEAPHCVDCHGKVDVKKVENQFTPEGVIDLCASCHSNRELMLSFRINPYVVEGYKDTYHGKILETGSKDVRFAICTNCHGAHTILPPEDPESRVHRDHIVETCKQCHPRANDKFVSYLVHPKKAAAEEFEQVEKAEPVDTLDAIARSSPRAIPPESRTGWTNFNNIVTWAMTLLLVIVLGIFGFHTILWFQRGFRGRMKPKVIYYRRIDGFHRFLHILVNVSFLTLAFTGLPQSYAHTALAKWMFENIMSLKTAQNFHYLAAIITGLYFLLHLIYLAIRIRKNGLKSILTGPNTMMFRKKDFQDFVQHIKWFFGKAPAPRFDRWTYWEKFDYFAVFWGVFVIGLSGLLRWADEFFGSLLGGGIITLADTIHKEEALLATAFIFIIHFFNTHLRAEKFPMDVSIYTGRISEDEFRKERPLEYQRLKQDGKLEDYQMKPISSLRAFISYLWGTVALLIGLFLLTLIIIGQFTGN